MGQISKAFLGFINVWKCKMFVDLKSWVACESTPKRIFNFGVHLLAQNQPLSWLSDQKVPCTSVFAQFSNHSLGFINEWKSVSFVDLWTLPACFLKSKRKSHFEGHLLGQNSFWNCVLDTKVPCIQVWFTFHWSLNWPSLGQLLRFLLI